MTVAPFHYIVGNNIIAAHVYVEAVVVACGGVTDEAVRPAYNSKPSPNTF